MGVNAQTSVPAFTAGQVLTAQQQTQINTGIPVFATTTTRDAAFGGTGEKVLAEGQFAYLEDSNTTQYYDGAAWQTLGGKIAQVVSTTKSDTFSTTSSTWVDLTGLSLTITPTATTSKVFVIATFMGDTGNLDAGMLRFVRGSTAIGVGDAAGSRVQASAISSNFAATYMMQGATMYLDSPATTSATTYKMQIQTLAGTVYINRSATDGNSAAYPRTISTITAFEVLA